MTIDTLIDAIVVTGPLGSGKTTFVGAREGSIVPYLQRTQQADGLTLLVNEAALGNSDGAYHTDGRRLSGLVSEGQLKMFGQSCVCCDGEETFRQALGDLGAGSNQRVVIEPTGIANANNIVDALLDIRDGDAPKFRVGHVLYLMPVRGFSKVEKHDGILAADHVVLTWLTGDAAEQEEVAAYVHAKNPDATIHLFTDDFDYGVIDSSEPWSKEAFRARRFVSIPEMGRFSFAGVGQGHLLAPPGAVHSHGHHHHHHDSYAVASFELNPYEAVTAEGDTSALKEVLDQLAARGTERVKGYVRINREEVIPFDVVRGEVVIGGRVQDPHTIYGNGSLEVIDRHLPDDLAELVEPLTDAARDAVALRGASLDEMSDLFRIYMDSRIEQSPLMGDADQNFVPQSYEGVEVAFSLAEQICREHRESDPLSEALTAYVDLYRNGAAQATGQDNEFFIRATFGMKILNALTKSEPLLKDASFDLCRISEEYLTALGSFSGSDLARIEEGSDPEGYRSYMRKMAAVAREHLSGDSDTSLYSTAIANLDALGF